MTATQLARRVRGNPARVWEIIRFLRRERFVRCLTPKRRSARIYWLTRHGCAAQQLIADDEDQEVSTHFTPRIDWDLYGAVCTSHRATMILNTDAEDARQTARIRKRAIHRDANVRMCSSNAHRAMLFLREHELVRAVKVRKRRLPHYVLTGIGLTMKQLLEHARNHAWEDAWQ